MKKILLLVQFIISICLTACYTNIITDYDNEGGGSDDPADQTLTIPDPTQLDQTVYADSPSCKVEFTTTSGWETYIQSSEAKTWITLSPASNEYPGEYTLQILLSENTTGSPRSAQIELTSGGQVKYINITQEAIREDGSFPAPYEPDPYEVMVDNIKISELTEGVENENNWREIRINYEGEQVQYIEKWSIVKLEENYNEMISEAIHLNYLPENNRLIYEHDIINENSELIQKNYNECLLNEQQHIKEAQIRNFNYLDAQEEQPQKPKLIIYSYRNFRLQEIRNDYEQTQYVWNDQNRMEVKQKSLNDQEYSTQQTLTYNEVENNKANLDLNQVLLDDIMSMSGFFGKRSRNLLASLSDSKGSRSEFTYTFNEFGYVDTITVTHFFEGIEEPIKQLYTIGYKNGY